MLSIIIPIHNSEKFLRECLNSILFQTYKNFEIILVENNSTDRSLDICKQYCLMYSDKIRLFVEHRKGAAAARNRGIRESIGEYITFIDSDDYVTSYYFDSVCKYLDNDIDLICFSFFYVNEFGNVLNWYAPNFEKYCDDIFFSGKETASIFLLSKDIEGFCWNKIFKRSIFFNNDLFLDENKTSYEDMFFVFSAICCCKKVKFCNHRLVYYRQLNNSLSHRQYSRKYYEYVKTIFEIVRKSKSIQLYEQAEFFEASRFVHMIYNILKKDKKNLPNIKVKRMLRYLSSIIKNEKNEKLKITLKCFIILFFLVTCFIRLSLFNDKN